MKREGRKIPQIVEDMLAPGRVLSEKESSKKVLF
jgi:hypothetical protein